MMIVAEMSCNHAGSIGRAFKIIEEAAVAGSDAVKLQCWTMNAMVENNDQMAPRPWSDMKLFKLYQMAYTPWNWFEQLRDEIHLRGLQAWVSPFDRGALAHLERIGGWDGYKIASPEANDYQLIKAVAATGKPMAISSGSVGARTTLDACQWALNAGAASAIPVWCVSKYPSDPKDANLGAATILFRALNAGWGLSDHSPGIGVAVAAASLGAAYIEKHLMLDDGTQTLDGLFSLAPTEFHNMVLAIRAAKEALGREYSPPEPLKFVRRVFASTLLERGSQLGPHNLTTMRSEVGVCAQYIASLYGKKVNRTIRPNTPVYSDDFA